MPGVQSTRRLIATDGLVQSVIEAGQGPLVVLLHGFPELAISWTAQVRALAEAGVHAVAPDMRGYGGTVGPDDREAHTLTHLAGDVVDLVRALGAETCTIVGHDFGAAVAWRCALTRPDVFTAVAGLSVPFQPRNPKGPPTPMMAALSRRAGLGDLYINRFQAPDAHVPFDADPATALRKVIHAYDGATPDADQSTGFLPPGVDLLDSLADDPPLPSWLTADHFAEWVAAFETRGFERPLDWYRCLDLDWSLTAWLQGRRIRRPSLFITGERDPVRHYAGRHEAAQAEWLTDLRAAHVLPGAGHWIQQERPDEVSALLVEFLRSI